MFKRIKDFLNQVYLEMNKVSWPSYNELRGSTYLIIIFFLLYIPFFDRPNYGTIFTAAHSNFEKSR